MNIHYYDLEIILSMNRQELTTFKRAITILRASGVEGEQVIRILLDAFVQRRQNRERVNQNRRAS